MHAHYGTLGVQTSATPEEIKAAFRRLASKHHPDKHPPEAKDECEGAMAAINRAYQVLSDPESRARYDRTGDDQRENRVDGMARGMLVEAFREALSPSNPPDVLGIVRRQLDYNALNLEIAQSRALKEHGKLLAKRGKVRAKKGEDLFAALLESQILVITTQLEAIAEGLKVVAAAQRLLENYESDNPPADESRGVIRPERYIEVDFRKGRFVSPGDW